MISFAPSAMKAVKCFVARCADPVAGLRIRDSGAGCAGRQYGLRLEQARHDDDVVVVDVDGLTLLADPFSAPLLEGVKVDFDGSLSGSGFKFDNSRVSRSCACGQSFTA